MDKLDFAEGMKILYSCYHKDLNNDDFIIWYEMLKDIKPVVFKKTIIEICKEKSFMPTVHDILDKSKNVSNSYYLSIIDKMYDDGYFKKGYQELTDKHANRNYDKAIRWIEKGINISAKVLSNKYKLLVTNSLDDIVHDLINYE